MKASAFKAGRGDKDISLSYTLTPDIGNETDMIALAFIAEALRQNPVHSARTPTGALEVTCYITAPQLSVTPEEKPQ